MATTIDKKKYKRAIKPLRATLETVNSNEEVETIDSPSENTGEILEDIGPENPPIRLDWSAHIFYKTAIKLTRQF